MKKLLLTSAAIATFFASTTAYGSESSKFFLTANAGLSKTSNIQDYKSDNDMYFGLGVGYYIAPNIRMSLTFDHFFNPTHKLTQSLNATTPKVDFAKYGDTKIAVVTKATADKATADKSLIDATTKLAAAKKKSDDDAAAAKVTPTNKTLNDTAVASAAALVTANDNKTKADTEATAAGAALKAATDAAAVYQAATVAAEELKTATEAAELDKANFNKNPKDPDLEAKAKASADAVVKATSKKEAAEKAATDAAAADQKATNTTTKDSVVSTAKGSIDVLLVNAFVDVFEADSFKLFVGAGVGMGQVGTKITVTKNGTDAPTQSLEYKKTMGVAFAAYVGASYELSDGVNAELTYSYRDLGQAKAPKDGLKGFHYTGHHVGAGIRFDL